MRDGDGSREKTRMRLILQYELSKRGYKLDICNISQKRTPNFAGSTVNVEYANKIEITKI